MVRQGGPSSNCRVSTDRVETAGASLSSFGFYAAGNTTTSPQLSVAQWNPDTNVQNQATNVLETSLLTASVAAVETLNSTGNFTAISFDNLGLSLNANTKYIA